MVIYIGVYPHFQIAKWHTMPSGKCEPVRASALDRGLASRQAPSPVTGSPVRASALDRGLASRQAPSPVTGSPVRASALDRGLASRQAPSPVTGSPVRASALDRLRNTVTLTRYRIPVTPIM